MARVFITGSADGLGLMAAQLLVAEGHQVIVHGRSPERAAEALRLVDGAEAAVSGDLSSMAETQRLAEQVNGIGRCDAVIHNAGVGYREGRRGDTEDGLPPVFAVNTMATYILTALIERPARLVYLSSGMHYGARAEFDDLTWEKRRWSGSQAYAETKLHDALIAFAVARPALAGRAVQRRRSGLGTDADGRGRGSGRHRARPAHAGVAGGERRCGGEGERPVLP